MANRTDPGLCAEPTKATTGYESWNPVSFETRIARFVRKDATVSYLGQRFEVPYELSVKTVRLVVDPHAGRVVGVEDAAGVSLGAATPLDMLANINRTRRKPEPVADPAFTVRNGPNLVELAHVQYHGLAQPSKKLGG